MSEKTQNAFQKYIIPAILAVALIGVILWAAQQKALEVLTQPESPLTASMLRDLEAGQRIEAGQIVGDMGHVKPARQVVFDMVQELIEAAETLQLGLGE